MSTKPQQSTECPVGVESCPWLDELQQLRDRVDSLEELVSRDPLTGLYNVRHLQETLPVVRTLSELGIPVIAPGIAVAEAATSEPMASRMRLASKLRNEILRVLGSRLSGCPFTFI